MSAAHTPILLAHRLREPLAAFDEHGVAVPLASVAVEMGGVEGEGLGGGHRGSGRAPHRQEGDRIEF